jgi:hypothetical protein
MALSITQSNLVQIHLIRKVGKALQETNNHDIYNNLNLINMVYTPKTQSTRSDWYRDTRNYAKMQRILKIAGLAVIIAYLAACIVFNYSNY